MMAFKPLHVFVIRDRNAALDWEELLQRDCAFRVTAADPSKPYGKQITCEKPDVILLDLADVRKEETILETIQNEACYPVLAIAAGGNPAPNGKMTSVLPRRNLNSEDDVNRFATMVSIKLKDLGSRYSGAASEAAKIRASRSGSQRLLSFGGCPVFFRSGMCRKKSDRCHFDGNRLGRSERTSRHAPSGFVYMGTKRRKLCCLRHAACSKKTRRR